MISPSRARAISKAALLLPMPVGPRMIGTAYGLAPQGELE